MPSQHALQEKAERAEEIKSLINQYKVIGAASLQKVRAAQLQELKKKLVNSAHLRVTKNATMKRAIETCDDSSRLKQFEEYLGGPTIFLFTDLNPFTLVLLLEKNKVKTIARSGDIAANDVIVPAGNTGLPPGPIISQLGAVSLPSRIESGSVWVTRDTTVAKKGEVISERLAAVLSKLNIKSVEVGLTMKVVYDDGTVITKDQLQLDLENLRQQISEVNAQALNLSLNAEYPLPENIALLLQMNHQQAFNLAITACILTSATSTILVQKAHMQMLSLSKRIGWTFS